MGYQILVLGKNGEEIKDKVVKVIFKQNFSETTYEETF